MLLRTAPRLLVLALAAWAVIPAAHRQARGEDFRVESKVFVGADKEPRIQSTTIFHEGLVYDYLEKPAEVTVLDTARHRFVLLDPGRHLTTEISTDEVSALNKNLKDWAVSQSDPFLQFLGDPKFEEQYDESTGQIVFNSPWLTYRVAPLDCGSEEIARRYREFSDWSTLLNTRLNPGSKLPFARLLVNEAMEKRRQLPREVQLTARSKHGTPFQKTTVRSEHFLTRTLGQADVNRLRQTEELMTILRRVDFAEYQKAAQ